jgi:hypothetical protein
VSRRRQIRLSRPPGTNVWGGLFFWHAACRTIAALTRAGDVDGLLRRLGQRDDVPGERDRPWERQYGAFGLGLIGDARAIPYLTTLIDPKIDPYIRQAAADALRRIGGPDAVQVLGPLLNDELYFVRRAALNLVATERAHEFASILEEMATSDPYAVLRMTASKAVAQMRDAA